MKENLSPPVVLLGRPSNNLKVGIVGLPNVGKSTFFNVLTKSAARAENFPFCTIDPEESRVAVPDSRFIWLCEQYQPASRVPAYLSVIDIAGLVRGASTGQGLGNAFLSHIKAVDGLFQMVRAFSGEEVTHVEGDVDPIRDMEIISEELRLKDIDQLTKAIEAARKAMRTHENDKQRRFELDTLEKLLHCVQEDKKAIRFGTWNAKEIDEVINSLQLLTAKSVVHLVNISEEDYANKRNKWLPKIKTWLEINCPGETMIPFSCAFELNEPSEGSVLPKIISTGYANLQLQYYFTAGPDEVRAWTVRRGSKAPQAAGVIHSDFERGFIMAEVMHFSDLKELGSETAVKAAGKYLQKGKEYVVEDGDIIFFKFNVGKKK